MAQTRKTSSRTRDRSTNTARDSHGRFKADHHVRNAAVGATALVGVAAAGLAAAFKFGLLDRLLPANVGHDAPDLALDAPDQHALDPDRRAPTDFRPDIDAPISMADREALRPAESSAPGFAADRNTTLADA